MKLHSEQYTPPPSKRGIPALRWGTELEALQAANAGDTRTPDWARVAELMALEAADKARLSEGVALSRMSPLKGEPSVLDGGGGIRIKATRTHCPDARGVVVVADDGKPSTLVVPCNRLTCPQCRAYLHAVMAERIEAAFAGGVMYRSHVEADDWGAVKRKAERNGVEFVTVPALGDGREVFATSPVVPEHEAVTDIGKVSEVLDRRPLNRTRVSASRGFLPPVADRAAVDPDRAEVVGFWNPRLGVEHAEQAATRWGFDWSSIEPSHNVVGGLMLDFEWKRSRHLPAVEGFLRDISFIAADEGADAGADVELGDQWDTDPLLHQGAHGWDDVPDEVYDAEAEQLAMEVAA